MSNSDQMQRFLFDNTDVRGVLVGLNTTYREVLNRHAYPAKIASVLGEMLAAVGLLSSTLKFDGRLSLMAQGAGPVTLFMAECNHLSDLRAIARWDSDAPADGSLQDLLGKGQLVMTIEPNKGRRYQGVVPIEKPQLAQCLEDYFRQSEQLDTYINLAADGERSAGMLLQALPSSVQDVERSTEDWSRMTQLAATLSSEELLALDNEVLLHRLYHEEALRLFDPETVRFGCDCSRERSLGALKSLDIKTLGEMLDEDGEIRIDCQFCNQVYAFDRTSIAEMKGELNAMEPDEMRH